MELSEKYKIELANLHKAVSSFEAALNATFDNLDSIGNDLIQNGRIQKFEYCAELAWKISKMHLELSEGIISNSPKGVYKTMFQSDLITEEEYSALFKTIEDRNLLSHIYKEETYQMVYLNIQEHLKAFKNLLGVLSK
ncbi:MAG: HI0074 family nucleotidyltransferase substrate-binding subunit [Bacteroidota bacterium]